MPIVRPSGRSRLAVLVKPVPPGAWPDHRNPPAAMLFIRDPEANAPSGAQELARRLLGLTRVDTRLVMFLTEGQSLDEAADLMNLRSNPARTHLRPLLPQTDVTS